MHNQRFKVSRMLMGVVALVFVVSLVSACGALEIGIEHLPADGSGDTIDWRATAETLQSEATRVNSGVVQPVPVVAAAAPTLVPVAVPSTQSQLTVAYVQGGDVWVRTLPEGEPQRLTMDGRNSAPRWSASGEWISFLKNPELPELWVMRRDGSEAAQVPDSFDSGAYAWSPVEDKIAFSEAGALHLFALEPGRAPTLFSQIDLAALESQPLIDKLAWSPNGQMLAFTLMTSASNAVAGADEKSQDGLWLLDVNSGMPTQLLVSEVPEKGPFVLFGWSGDGESVVYWQAPILSASILADGVPLYQVAVQGGTPIMLAESVLVHDDAVQSQPNGLSQLAVVVGSGREMWHNKRLQVINTASPQKIELTPTDQAVSSPAWSPLGDMLAYVGMADVSGVGGGTDAQTALQERQLWIVEANQPEPRPVPLMDSTRIEAPRWIHDGLLLVASFAEDGRVSLVVTDIWGESTRVIVEELTPAPEWFGYYGHVEWQNYFSVWRPSGLQPVAVPLAMTPTPAPVVVAPAEGRTLASILDGLTVDLTHEQAVALWGEPNEVTGSGLIIYKYRLNDGLWLWLGFPGAGPMSYAQVETVDGRRFALTPLEDANGAASEAAATPTPAAMDAATATPLPMVMPTATPMPLVVPTEVPTLVPTVMAEATPTP